MPVPTDITAGTLSITNGSTTVTGVGTTWLASDLRQGDLIIWIEGGDGFWSPILADVPSSNTSLTLAEPWEGPTLTGVRYRIRYQWDSSRVSAQSRQLIELLDNGNLLALSGLTGPGVPVFDGPHSMTVKPESDFINGVAYNVQVDTLADRDAYDGQAAGYSVLVSDVGDGRSAVYSKASNSIGDWTDPAYVTGATGDSGPFTELTVGPVTTVPYGTPASVNVVTIDPDTVRLDFSIPAGQNGTGIGVVVSIVPGDGVLVDSSDPSNPVVSLAEQSSYDLLSLALELSQAKGSPAYLGWSFADSYGTTEMVDTVSATNLDTSEVGYLKPTINYSADITTTGFSAASSQASSDPAHVKENAFDKNPATAWLSGLTGSANGGVSWIGQDFGSGNTKAIRRVTLLQNYANGRVTNGWVEWSDNGSSWTTVAVMSGWDSSAPYTFEVPASGAHRYWRVRAANGPPEGNNWWVQEIQMMELNGFGNLTVASQIIPVAFEPQKVEVLVRVLPTDALTLNTDFFIDVSRDNLTWTTAVLDLAYNVGSVSVLTADVDVSSQPAGVSPRYRIRSANNKNFKVDGVATAFKE